VSEPFRVALVNLCEQSYGYGPGASEYLRAALLAAPTLAGRVACEVFFLENVPAEGVAERVLAWEPDLVGFTCYSWNLWDSGEAARAIRRRAGELPIVWGGCSFSHLRERSDWFEWWDAVDAVAVGFGEATLIELSERLAKLPRDRRRTRLREDAPPAGLGVRGLLGLRFGPQARAPAHLDELPSPYLAGTARPVPRPFVEVARGCLYQCTFCSDARVSREGLFLAHSVDRLAAEVAAVVDWPCARWIDAGASTANVTDAAFAETCEAVRRGDPAQRLVYSFQMYPSLVRPSQREALRGVRVGKILIGLQSTTRATFARMRRAGQIAHLRRAIEVLRDAGPLYVSVLLGLPGETRESFAGVMDQVTASEGVYTSVHRLLALPGTQMHTRAEELGLEFDPRRYYRVTATREMSADDLGRAQDDVVERAVRLGPSPSGAPRIDWTNFDVQPDAFGAPVLPRGSASPSGSSAR
jgi:radical SAM superfamily enzyme YgiQ (UPF0313 family)